MPKPHLTVKSRPEVWTDAAGDAHTGVLLMSGRARLFITEDQLREVADQLHDAADIYEEHERKRA